MPAPQQRSIMFKISHWYFLISVFTPSRLQLLSKTSWTSVFLRIFFTHIHLMICLSSMVNIIAATTLLLTFSLHRCLQRIYKKNKNNFYAVKISNSLAILSESFIQIGYFLSRVSILTRDIDIANLSVCPSVCP